MARNQLNLRISRSPTASPTYAHGKALGGNTDRRQAALAGTVTVYWVSSGVLTVSVVTIIHTD
ncbi:hypothetical protein [Streptomyces sp. URMC 129]|uniref:hypothetical protein n=1 Tax=Streptomyces sp. URMC 129 TaxID=3423407 RepID=UPI003F1BE52A